jgi:hypothetical protein
MTGKISRLPEHVRDQLNDRLADGLPAKKILPWLNRLPEVRATLKQDFHSEPIDEGNLSEYRKRGFRKWKIQRDALEFASEFHPDDVSGQPSAASLRTAQFVHWISQRLAAAAHSSPIPDDPQAELRQLREFLADIVALRRGELVSRRLAIEEQRLAAVQLKNQQVLEEEFWKWTKRADIQSKLFPHHDPDKIRRTVVRMLDRELLGVTTPDPDEPDPDPVCYI